MTAEPCMTYPCERPHYALGLCLAHYSQLRRRGAIPRPRRTPQPRRAHIPEADRIEDLRWLLDSREPLSRIPERLGTTPPALARWLYRHGAADLARQFNRAEATA